MNDGNVTLVTPPDLSAEFRNINGNGISGTSLNRFRFYLSNGTQIVSVNSIRSQPAMLKFGAPQGSILGRILFNRTSLTNPHPTSVHVANTAIPFSLQAKNLGIILSNNLSMEKHVTNIFRSAYIEIRRTHKIGHYFTFDAMKTLVYAIVMSKLDYFNSLLSSSPKHFLHKLQKGKKNILKPDLFSKLMNIVTNHLLYFFEVGFKKNDFFPIVM